jgi:transcriptional antiterminator RfaH
MNNEAGLRWYVVQTHINAEAKAAANLALQGFSLYLPRYLKRRIDTVARPLFPRYLFVAMDVAAQRWRSIQSTIGVSHLVCRGTTPASVDDSVVNALKAREDECGFVRLERRSPFSPGDQVRVVDGAFVDSIALVEGVTDRERVSILLEFLGRKVRVLVGAELIAAA